MPERDANGHFQPGNKVASHEVSGPRKTSMRLWNERFRKTRTDEEFDEVCRLLVEMCREKDMKAIQYYLDHMMGKPQQSVQVDGMESLTQLLAFEMKNAAEGA